MEHVLQCVQCLHFVGPIDCSGLRDLIAYFHFKNNVYFLMCFLFLSLVFLCDYVYLSVNQLELNKE